MDGGNKLQYKLYFIRDCDCGQIINEHLLPNSIQESNLTSLFTTCVGCLIYANTRFQLKKFVNMLTRSVGKYSEITIENQSQLRELLNKLCEVCGTCPNFINEREIEKCSICDKDNGEDEKPPMKKVIFDGLLLFSKMFFFCFKVKITFLVSNLN